MLSQPLPPLVPSPFVHVEDDAALALDFALARPPALAFAVEALALALAGPFAPCFALEPVWLGELHVFDTE